MGWFVQNYYFTTLKTQSIRKVEDRCFLLLGDALKKSWGSTRKGEEILKKRCGRMCPQLFLWIASPFLFLSQEILGVGRQNVRFFCGFFVACHQKSKEKKMRFLLYCQDTICPGGGRPESNENVAQNELKSSFSTVLNVYVFVTFSFLSGPRVDFQSHSFITLNFLGGFAMWDLWLRKTQEACGGLTGENPGAFPKARANLPAAIFFAGKCPNLGRDSISRCRKIGE